MNQFLPIILMWKNNLKNKKAAVGVENFGKSFAEKGTYGLADGRNIRHLAVGALGCIERLSRRPTWERGWRTKEQKRKSEETLGGKGLETKVKTAKKFVKADTLVTNFDRTIRKIKEESEKPAPDEAELNELRGSLDARIKYTTDKIDRGLVDFGATKHKFQNGGRKRRKRKRGLLGNRYFLVSKLSEAMVADNLNASEQEMGPRLAKFLDFQERDF